MYDNWRASEASETLLSHVYGISRHIPNQKMGNFLIMICSMLAAGIVHDTFAGEAGEGEVGEGKRLEATSTATSTGTFTAQARKPSVSYLLKISFAKHSRAHAY